MTMRNLRNNPRCVGIAPEDIGEEPSIWSVDDATYHADVRCESSSTISKLIDDPAQYYRERVLGEKLPKYSPAMALGTALHHLILTPDLFGSEVQVLPKGYRAKASQELIAAHPGVTWLEPGAIEKVYRMESIIKAARDAAAFEGSDAEMVYAALLGDAECEREIAFRMRHPESGVGIKCKVDMLAFMGNDEIWQIDLKTSRHPEPCTFVGSFLEYGYARQAALYRYILHHAYPQVKRVRVFYVAVSNTDRPGCQVYSVSDDVMHAGWAQCNTALRFLRELVEADSEEAWLEARLNLDRLSIEAVAYESGAVCQ